MLKSRALYLSSMLCILVLVLAVLYKYDYTQMVRPQLNKLFHHTHGVISDSKPVSGMSSNLNRTGGSLTVGVISGYAPFSDKTSSGEFRGLVVDIFKNAAKSLQLNYTFVDASNLVDQGIKDLSQGKYDILIGPISVTYGRMDIINYTHPFFLNKLGLVVPYQRVTFWEVLSGALGTSIKYALLGLLLCIVLFSHLFWYFEHGASRECKMKYKDSIGYGFWAVVSTFLQQVLYDPRKFGSRIVLTIWLMMSMLFMTAASALVTSSLTVSMTMGGRDYSSVSELYDKKIAVVKGTIEVEMAKRIGAHIILVDSVQDGIKAVNARKVDAFMNDYYVSQYQLLSMNLNNVRMSNLIVSNDVYAFALPQNTPLERTLSLAITQMQDSGMSGLVCQKYLVDANKSCEF